MIRKTIPVVLLCLVAWASESKMVADGGHSPLIIGSFQAVEGQDNLWTFSGTVSDTAMGHGTITITFGGLPSIQGKTTTANADGTFSATYQLQAGEGGIADAQATDQKGNASNIALDVVDPS